MGVLAGILVYLNEVDDDEARHLYEQSTSIFALVQGTLSMNVAAGEQNLGLAYMRRATRAYAACDLDQCVANLGLALPHFRESARISRAINHVDRADESVRSATDVEELLRQVTAESWHRQMVAATSVAGSLSLDVAVDEYNKGIAYHKSALEALEIDDLDRYAAELELALPCFRKAARIYRAFDHVDDAEESVLYIVDIEEMLGQITIF